MIPRLVSIDLGSAYTKIGIRRNLNSTSVLLFDLPLADETSYCIPSVAACLETGAGVRWVFGAAAAAEKPRSGVRVIRNWKAGLFPDAEKIDSQVAAPTISEDDALEVALNFFRTLRISFENAEGVEISKFPVRICIPKVRGEDAARVKLSEILTRAGWDPATPRCFVFEPEANVLGVVSRGTNSTWDPPIQDFKPVPPKSPFMQKMIKAPGMAAAFRQMGASYSVFVIDIGAFTTDFAFVKFDASFMDDSLNKPAVLQDSRVHGVRNLDQSVHTKLNEEFRAAIRAMSQSEWDGLKAKLYRGENVAMRNPAGGTLFTSTSEQNAVSKSIASFAEKVWIMAEEFLTAVGTKRIDSVALTGGGTAVPRIRSALEAAFDGDQRTHNAADLMEKGGEALRGSASNAEGDASILEMRDLIRGATAMGATSVFFE